MASKLTKPSTKAIVISIAIVAILATAVTGTVLFLKDNGRTEAAEIEAGTSDMQNGNAEQNNETTNSDAQNTQNPEEAGNQEATQVTANNNQGNAGTANNNAVTGNANGTGVIGNTNANGNATTTDEIQETTISRNETVEIPEKKVGEGHYVGWAPMEVNADLASAKVKANKDEVVVTKEAKTVTGENLATVGEIITYNITVKNNSERDLKGIEVKDRIPEMTEYVKDSVDNNGETIIKDNEVVGIKWNIDLEAGEEKTVSFEVEAKEVGTVKNLAIANGEESNNGEETKTSVVTTSKTAIVYDEKNIEKNQPARVGDKIKFTITIDNTNGEIAGKTTVADTDIKKLVDDKILSVEETSQEIVNKLIEGYKVEVAENEKTEISFMTKVLNVNGAVRNAAIIGDSNNEENNPEVVVDTADLSVNKEVISKAKSEDGKYALGEEVKYRITVTNNGSTTLKEIKVEDKLSGTVLISNSDVIGELAPGKSDSVEYKYVIEQKDLEQKIENIATATAKDGTTNSDKEEIETEKRNPDYELTKTATLNKISTNKTAGKAEAGDTVHYVVKVKNTGNVDLINITVTDTMKDATGANRTATVNVTVAEKEKVALEYDYLVSQDDVNTKTTIYNKVTTGNPEKDKETNTPVVDKNGIIEVKKEVTNTPVNGLTFVYGETVKYKVTVKNKGNITLNNVTVTDPLPNIVLISQSNNIGTLAPGATGYVEYSYVIQKVDLRQTTLNNVATVTSDEGVNGKGNATINIHNGMYNYTVNYFLDENTTPAHIDTLPGFIESTISSVEVEKYLNQHSGYEVNTDKGTNGVEGLPLVITTNESTNVINVYYRKASYPYTINYYKDTISTDTFIDAIPGTAIFGSTITARTDYKVPTGYKFEGIAPSMVIDVANNVINVVYVPDLNVTKNLQYTINYYKRESASSEYVKQVKDSKTTSEAVWINSKQTTLTYQKDVNANKYTGYNFVTIKIGDAEYTANNIPATLPNGTVIDVYYEKAIEQYTVTYIVNNNRWIVDGLENPKAYDDGTTGVKVTELKPETTGTTVFATWKDVDTGMVYAPGAALPVIDRNITLEAQFATYDETTQSEVRWERLTSDWSIMKSKSKRYITSDESYQIFEIDDKTVTEFSFTDTNHIEKVYEIKDGKETLVYSYTKQKPVITINKGSVYKMQTDNWGSFYVEIR